MFCCRCTRAHATRVITALQHALLPLHTAERRRLFFSSSQNHYSQDASWSVNCSQPSIDLSRDGKPCFGENGTATGSAGDEAHYNGYTFTHEAVSIIETFAANASSSTDASKRLFIYFAIHNTHSPTQAPLRLQQLYSRFSAWPKQQVFNAMVSTVDETAANVSAALKRTGLWAETLLVWSTVRQWHATAQPPP